MSDLQKDTAIEGVWGSLSNESKQGPLRKFSIDFDLDAQTVDMMTKARDNNGTPMFDWKLDSSLEDIKSIKRIELVDPKKIF